MKQRFKYLTALLAFLLFNLYSGIRLFNYIKEFNLQHKSIAIKILEGTTPELGGNGKIDADRDGEDEVVFASKAGFANIQSFSVFKPLHRDYAREFFGDTRTPLNFEFFECYYNNQLKTYVFRFLEARSGSLFIREIDNRGNILDNQLQLEGLARPIDTDGQWSLHPQLADLDEDNNNELVIILKSDSPGNPRGAACFDSQSGKKLWEYYSGTRIEKAVFHDLDHDGNKEIILTSYAPNNEIEYNGTNDRFSYVIVLDHKGNVKWKKEIGDHYSFSYVAVSDQRRKGRCDIVAAADCTPGRIGKVFIFDALTGEQKQSFPSATERGISFSKPCVLNLTGSQPRIYIGDSSGKLRIFDKNLSFLKKIEKTGPIHVLNTTSPNEHLYYLYTRRQNRLLVFDWNLEKEIFAMDFNFDGVFEFVPLRSKSGHYALILADKLYLLTETRITFKEIVQYWLRSDVLFTLLSLLFLNGFFINILHQWKIPFSLYFHGAQEDIIETSELFEIVLAIIHQAKNPISTILWTAEKMKRDSSLLTDAGARENFTQLADVLLENVNILKQQTHEIAKLVESDEPGKIEVPG